MFLYPLSIKYCVITGTDKVIPTSIALANAIFIYKSSICGGQI